MEARKLAITHASGLLAEAILEKLPELNLSSDSIVLLDDESHIGTRLAYRDSYLKIQDQLAYDYADCNLVLMLEYDQSVEEKLSSLDAILLSHTLQGDDQPVFALNPEARLDIAFSQQTVMLPGAELGCLLGILPTLHQGFPITHVNTVLMRSAQLRGKAGVDELASQTVALLNSREVAPRIYPLQIAFNLIPQASNLLFDRDLANLMGSGDIKCEHQVVDVPIFHGFSAAVQLTFESEVDIGACQSIFKGINNAQLKSVPVSPISDCKQSFGCVINHLVQAPNQPKNLHFWMTADPIRYGLANNYANVTDILLKTYL
jgi:aspartate-semialdehyde dehydrogenase